MLYITIGISGSGKSTWVRNHMKNNDILICPDNIRKELTGDISDNTRNAEVWGKAYYRLRTSMDKYDNVFFDSTCLNTRTLKDIIKNSHRDYEDITIVMFNDSLNWELCRDRVSKDEKNGVDRAKTSEVIRNNKPLIQDMSERYYTLKSSSYLKELKEKGINFIFTP